MNKRPAFASWLGTTNEITRTFLAAGNIPDLINLAGGLPAAELLPADQLANIAQRAIIAHPDDTLGYSPIEGLADLREALANRFSSHALRLGKENILVTTSGMQALDLLGKVLLNEGDLIASQFPTYLGALDAWRPRQPCFRNIQFAADFDPIAALQGAQFAYTVPNFSNPTGKQVSESTRQSLVDAAQTTGTWLVEDDPYGTLAYDDKVLPRLIELSARSNPSNYYNGPVIYIGTVSKQIAPGLRIGWVIAAPQMIEALTLAKQGSDMCTSGLTQRIALESIESGLIESLQTRATVLYRERRDAMCKALENHLSEWFKWQVPVGGMFVWVQALDQTLVVHPHDTFEFSVTVCGRSETLFRRHSQSMSRKSNEDCGRRQPRPKGATEPLHCCVAALDNGTTIAIKLRLALEWLCGSEPECIMWMDH